VRALAIDVGSTSIRTAIVDENGHVSNTHQQPLSVSTTQPGEVELDARVIGQTVLELSQRTLNESGGCDVVGIANQRATTLLFDARTNEPVGPALGWQDLRTVIDCLVLQGEGLRLAPNQSATKARWLLRAAGRTASELRFATIETYVASVLSKGGLHVSDHSNAGVTGLFDVANNSWDERALSMLELEPVMMPQLVATMGQHGAASALAGAPIITALVGDQSASLFGQSCIEPGSTKITFGTGAMADQIRGEAIPDAMTQSPSGCFPIVARSDNGHLVWGVEGIVLSASTCIDWLRDDVGLIQNASETESLALSITSSEGVQFVPAFVGLGTPTWDFGARGAFFGLTRGSTRAHLVRAVLEGIAHRGVDLLEALYEETGIAVEEIRVDGGMSQNMFMMQTLANYANRPVALSSENEATTRGAGLMALVAAGALTLSDVEALWHPRVTLEPLGSNDQRISERSAWLRARHNAERTVPDLSSVSF
jgi:glycerol kinase